MRSQPFSLGLIAPAAAWCVALLMAGPGLAQTWTQTSAPLTNRWTCIASSADGSRLVAAADSTLEGNLGPIYLSTNSGSTWTQTTAPLATWVSVASSADGTKLAALNYGGVYVSSDSGVTWTPTSESGGRQMACSADGNQLLVASGLYRSTNFGTTWTPLPVSGWCIASSADGSRLVTAYFFYHGFPQGGILISTNSGESWTETVAPLASWTGWTALASSADGMKLAATIGYTSFPTGPGPIFIFSPATAGSWVATSSPTSHWTSVASSADGTKLIAASLFHGIHTSVDSGLTWISNNAPVAQWTGVACSADGARMFATSEDGGIWTAQIAPTPLLNIAPSGTNLVLSWIVPSTDFILQENPDLDPAKWIDIAATPGLNYTNVQYQVTTPTPAGHRFYRLKH